MRPLEISFEAASVEDVQEASGGCFRYDYSRPPTTLTLSIGGWIQGQYRYMPREGWYSMVGKMPGAEDVPLFMTLKQDVRMQNPIPLRLVGIAANKSLATGLPVDIASLIDPAWSGI